VIKVEIVDSSPVYVAGLVTVLTDSGMAASAAGTRPARVADVYVVNPEALGDRTLSEYLSGMRPAPVLLLAEHPDTPVLAEYAEASGLVHRQSPSDTVVRAVRTVAEGGTFWPPGVAPVVPQRWDSLSPREQQVLHQIARGLTHGQIANRMAISRHTVDTYVKRIRTKLVLGNKAELTRAALTGGLVSNVAPPLR
jgi:DNA-binding NarL/FixJ family response regulator